MSTTYTNLHQFISVITSIQVTHKVTDKLMGISISSTQVKFIANTMFLLILIELSALLLFY